MRPASSATLAPGILGIGASLAIGLAAIAPTASSAADPGTIKGKVRGHGSWTTSPGEDIVTVRALRAETGRLARSARLTGSLRYRLKVPGDFYVLFGQAADLSAARTHRGHGHVFEVRAGRRTREDVKLRPVGPSAAVKRALRGAIARGARSRTKVFTVSPKVRVSDAERDYTIPLDDLAFTYLTQGPCPDDTRLQLVVHPSQRGILRDEIRRSNSRLADPSTRLRARFVDPRFEVRGGGEIAGGEVSVQLRVVNLRTGDVVSHLSTSGQVESFFELMDDLLNRLFEEACGESEVAWTGTVTSLHDRGVPGDAVTWSSEASVTFMETSAGSGVYHAAGTVHWTTAGTDPEGCLYSGEDTRTIEPPSDGSLGIFEMGDHIVYDLTGDTSDPPYTVTVTCPGDPPIEAPWEPGPWALAEGQEAPLDAEELQGTYELGNSSWTWDLTSIG